MLTHRRITADRHVLVPETVEIRAVDHLRTTAKQRVLVPETVPDTVGDQKRHVFASKNGRSNPGRRLPQRQELLYELL